MRQLARPLFSLFNGSDALSRRNVSSVGKQRRDLAVFARTIPAVFANLNFTSTLTSVTRGHLLKGFVLFWAAQLVCHALNEMIAHLAKACRTARGARRAGRRLVCGRSYM